MLGRERGTVKLFAHEHAWDDHGARYCARISAALGDLALAVEHVGSTSVSGLCAKPIIDVAVGVQSFNDRIIFNCSAGEYISCFGISNNRADSGCADVKSYYFQHSIPPVDLGSSLVMISC